MTRRIARPIPNGYRETLWNINSMQKTGKGNKITSLALSEFYEKVCIITRGKLFSKERLKTIIRMNFHGYDYLIKKYENGE